MRTSLIPVLFLLCSASFVSAQTLESPAPLSLKEVSRQAEAHYLAKERAAAAEVLNSFLARTDLKNDDRSAAGKLLQTVSETFLTEEGQRLFQEGESLITSEPERAIEKFKDVYRLEGPNANLMRLWVLSYLKSGECTEAARLSEQALKVYPRDATLRLLGLQVKACQKQWRELAAEVAGASAETEALKVHFELVRVKVLIENQQREEAAKILESLRTEQPDFAEITYWRWFLQEEGQSQKVQEAYLYQKQCQNISARQMSFFRWTPSLCQQGRDIDRFLAQLERGTE